MSARGWFIVVVSLAAIGAGIAVQWVVFVAVGGALLLVLLTPLTLTLPRNAQWVDVSAPARVVRGDEAAIAIDVSIHGGTSRWVSAVDGAGMDRVFLPFSGVNGEMTWHIDTAKRGLFHVGPARLEGGDPFGVMAKVLATREPSPVLVVPRVHGVNVMQQTANATSADRENAMGSEVFHSIREYVVGDPMKMVHWRSTARAGKLMVRRMVDTTMPWLLVVLDVNARAYDRQGALFEDFDAEAFEQSVDTAASWAWHGCGPEQRVLLTTTSMTQQPVGVEVTARTRESALDWLALITDQPTDECGPGRVEAYVRTMAVSRAVFITGRATGLSAPWVARWRSRTSVETVVGHT